MRIPVSSKDAPAPAGPYAQGIVAKGEFVFLSGQTPRTAKGIRITNAPFDRQARQALENLEAVARAAGLSLKHAVKVTVFLKDLTSASEFNAIYSEFIGDPPPARTLVQSSFVEFDVEVDAILATGPA